MVSETKLTPSDSAIRALNIEIVRILQHVA
jgi:hypothetical protein